MSPKLPRLSQRAVVALILGGAAPLAAASRDAALPPAVVRTSEARLEALGSVLWVPGTVVSRRDARVAAEIAGRLNWVAEVGDQIADGGVLARIDPTALELEQRESEARIRRLEASLAFVERQRERTARLVAQGIGPRNDLDDLTSQREVAVQELEEARVAHEQIAFRLARSEVRAPFGGQVVERLGDPGEYVGPGSAVVRLVDVEHAEVQARAPLAAASHLRDGARLAVEGPDGPVERTIRRVIPVGDERSRMLELRISLPRVAWVVGTPVRVALPTSGVKQVLAVPRDALVLRDDGTFLFKIDHDGKAVRVAVETGIGAGDVIEVRGDVAAGDRVVIRGNERLRSGQAVTVADG